mmetsp:Transcript_13436/g.27415  ORF Transcript_13436/g.27415 Transcript_13436/m.27415 type:complete len:89 (+) Transcript_13436:1636-1902(+)
MCNEEGFWRRQRMRKDLSISSLVNMRLFAKAAIRVAQHQCPKHGYVHLVSLSGPKLREVPVACGCQVKMPRSNHQKLDHGRLTLTRAA